MFRRIFNKKKKTDQNGAGRRKQKRVTPRQGTRVLLVDDSKTIRFVMSKMLRESGYQVLEASNGITGLEMAVEYQPDLIFMDVIMPGMDGFQVTRKLRKIKSTESIPIIVISGNRQAVEQFWATRIGANDYMEKPFERRELFYRLEKVLYHPQVA